MKGAVITGRGCFDSRVEESLSLFVTHVPHNDMEEMPGMDCAYIVGNGITCVAPCKSWNETVDEDWSGGCTLILRNLAIVTEDMIDKEARAIAR